jgi:two-component system chemotaxis response regulator CheY
MPSDKKKDFNILVVDDSDLSRKSIVSIVERNGFNVIAESNNAQDGLLLARTNPVHLCIIDIVMPDQSGIELLKSLNEVPGMRYYIMISSLTNESIIINSISNGANDFLKKPFSEKDLLLSVQKLYEHALMEKII